MDQELQDIFYNCSVSTRVTAKTIFPERFSLPFSPNIHDPIFDLIDGPDQLVAIAAPRGFGKTSIAAMAKPGKAILFKQIPFIVYINKSETASTMQTDNLRRELVTSKEIKAFFGSVKTRNPGAEEFDEQFSKKAWVAYDTFILPRGAGQQVRGVLFKNSRPGLIIIDDLEDPELIESKNYRDKLFQWLYADVMKAVPRIGPESKTWKIIYIDTLKHEDSVLQRLLDSPDWKSVRLEACDDEFKSIAPEYMSDAEIRVEWQRHVEAGQTDVFFRELRNLPISTKDSSFQSSYFKYYNIPPEKAFREGTDLKLHDAELSLDKGIETVVIVDPAKTTNMSSADSAIVGVGLDLMAGRLLVRDIISKRMKPDELYKETFDMARRLEAKVLGVETTGLEEFIKQPIKNYMFRKGVFCEIVWLRARGGVNDEKGKVKRIKSLIPYYRLGYIYHNASCQEIGKLEQQLTMYPRSKLWDIMDALAYIIEMMELGERYFGSEGDEDPDDPEAQYNELTYEDPVEDWRPI